MSNVIIQARFYTKGRKQKPRAICIHTAECPVFLGVARNVANYFAGKSAPQASAYYCVDPGEIVQCVDEGDTAWHAGPTNDFAIGIELAGYARFTKGEWLENELNRETLTRAAKLCAEICQRHDITIVKLSNEELKSGASGLFGHDQVKTAYGSGTHWDPGPGFPWDEFMVAVQAADAENTCV